ncbi:hypothetical protein Ancab_024503 [Ancistrocladus abbreviatus]
MKALVQVAEEEKASGGDGSVISMAVTRLHVKISSGTSRPLAGGLYCLYLHRLGALSVEIPLTDDVTIGRASNDATEIRVGRGETCRFISQFGSAADIRSVNRVGLVAVLGINIAHQWEEASSGYGRCHITA